MAEGKNIEIKIAATGGAAAAAELRKVDTAVDSLSGGGGSSSGKGLKALAEETTKVTAAGVQMRTDWKNVGYQVQDVAVQVGSGTSAFRALGQQLPQLLSGFGPMGVLLGTVSAVALPLAGAMFSLGNNTEAAGEKAGEAADKLEKLSEARTDKAIAAALKDSAAYLQSLDDENAVILRNNQSLQRSIDLLKAQQNAKVAIQNAQAALDLAALDADESKTDAEKIQGRAAINRRVERERFENERTQAGFRVAAANNADINATGESTRAKEDLETAQGLLESREAMRKTLAARVFAANQAQASLPDLRKKEEDARKESASADLQAASKEQLAELDRQFSESVKQREDAEKKASSVTGAEREKLATLDGADGKSGTIAQTRKAVEDLTAAAEKLAIAAAKAREDAVSTQQVETVNLESQFEVSKRRLAANTISANSGTVKAVRKTADDFLQDQDRADKKVDREKERETDKKDILDRKKLAAQRDIETDISGLGKDAAKATRGLGAKGINPEGFNTLAAKIAKKGNPEQDKTDLSSFLAKVSLLVDKIPDSKSGSADAQTLREVELKLERKIAQLEQQIRNK